MANGPHVKIELDGTALSAGLANLAAQADRMAWLMDARPDRQPGETAPLLWRGDQA